MKERGKGMAKVEPMAQYCGEPIKRKVFTVTYFFTPETSYLEVEAKQCLKSPAYCLNTSDQSPVPKLAKILIFS